MVETILDDAQNEIALYISRELRVDRTSFYSKDQYSQQIGIIKYPKGGKIKPHFHNRISREVIFTQEVLIVRKGKVKVNLFDQELKYLTSIILKTGDTIFLISGGHSFEMLEDTEMLEVKQGPYSGMTNDKTHFESEV